MTQHEMLAEQQAWSQYLAALHAKEAAWTARCIAWGDAVRSSLRGEALQRLQLADEQVNRCRERERQLYRQWQRIAYPLYDVPQPDDEPDTGSES